MIYKGLRLLSMRKITFIMRKITFIMRKITSVCGLRGFYYEKNYFYYEKNYFCFTKSFPQVFTKLLNLLRTTPIGTKITSLNAWVNRRPQLPPLLSKQNAGVFLSDTINAPLLFRFRAKNVLPTLYKACFYHCFLYSRIKAAKAFATLDKHL